MADKQRFDAFTVRFIHSKVRRLVGRAGFTAADHEDLFQRFALDLLRRRAKFDPEIGTWEAFVVVVCENCLATILQHRRAEMRSIEHEAGSLHRRVQDGEGNYTELGDTLPDTQPGRRTGCYRRSAEETVDVVEDVRRVTAGLPQPLRDICRRLQAGETKSGIARRLGISQGAFYGLLRQIAEHFERAGLREYLP